MTDWFIHIVERERRREEIRRAADHYHQRQLLEHTDATHKSLRRHEIILAALGDRLVQWGCRLQSRYRRLAHTTSSMASDSVLAHSGPNEAGCA